MKNTTKVINQRKAHLLDSSVCNSNICLFPIKKKCNFLYTKEYILFKDFLFLSELKAELWVCLFVFLNFDPILRSLNQQLRGKKYFPSQCPWGYIKKRVISCERRLHHPKCFYTTSVRVYLVGAKRKPCSQSSAGNPIGLLVPFPSKSIPVEVFWLGKFSPVKPRVRLFFLHTTFFFFKLNSK